MRVTYFQLSIKNVCCYCPFSAIPTWKPYLKYGVCVIYTKFKALSILVKKKIVSLFSVVYAIFLNLRLLIIYFFGAGF